MSSFVVPFGYRGIIASCTSSMPLAMIEWQKNGKRLSGRVVSYIQDDDNSSPTSAELVSAGGFFSPDLGNYTCVVHRNDTTRIVQAEPISLNSTDFQSNRAESCSVVTNDVQFQLRILETGCQAWENDIQISMDMMAEVMLALSIECPNCITSSNDITITEGPMCSREVMNSSLFRGVISTSDKSRTGFIFCTLSRWQQHKPLVRLGGGLYFVDRSCRLGYQVNSSTECQVVHRSGSSYTLWIIGGVTGLFLVVILTSTFLFVTLTK